MRAFRRHLGLTLGLLAVFTLTLTVSVPPAGAQYYGGYYGGYGGYGGYGSSYYSPYSSYGYTPFSYYSPYSYYAYSPLSYSGYSSYYSPYSYSNYYSPYSYSSYYSPYSYSNYYSPYSYYNPYSSYSPYSYYGYNPYSYYNPYGTTCSITGSNVGIYGADISSPTGYYQPATVTIARGGTVTWTNCSLSAQHTVTSTTTGTTWDSGNLNPGQTFSFTFPTAGTFNYFCRLHGHTGTVTVT